MTADPFLTAICQKENIDAAALRPVQGGQINAIYATNDGRIVRVARTPNDSSRLRQEASLLLQIR